jgi:ribose transport system permease protein
VSQVAAVSKPRMRPLPPAVLRTILPFVSLALMLAAIGWLNPRAISYMGFNLMLNLAIPVALATIAQMFVITINELDLSVGFFISFIAAVSVTMLNGAPLLGAAVIVGSIFVYAAIGALIHLRNLPSIVVTLGMAFVWQGFALMVLPQPGGKAPGWLQAFMRFHVPFAPFPVIAAVLIGLIVHIALMKTSYGAVLRGIGGNQAAVARAGWSVQKARQDTRVHDGRPVRRVVGVHAGWPFDGGRRQHRRRLYAPCHRGRHPWRRRVYGRPSLSRRRCRGRANADIGFGFVAVFHAHSD